MSGEQTELEQLRQWKAEALEVLSGWEEVYEAAGRPGRLGGSKAEGVLAWVQVRSRADERAKRPDREQVYKLVQFAVQETCRKYPMQPGMPGEITQEVCRALSSLALEPEAREEHAFDDSEGSAFCTCGAGPFSNFGGSPLPAHRRHVAEVEAREVTDAGNAIIGGHLADGTYVDLRPVSDAEVGRAARALTERYNICDDGIGCDCEVAQKLALEQARFILEAAREVSRGNAQA